MVVTTTMTMTTTTTTTKGRHVRSSHTRHSRYRWLQIDCCNIGLSYLTHLLCPIPQAPKCVSEPTTWQNRTDILLQQRIWAQYKLRTIHKSGSYGRRLQYQIRRHYFATLNIHKDHAMASGEKLNRLVETASERGRTRYGLLGICINAQYAIWITFHFATERQMTVLGQTVVIPVASSLLKCLNMCLYPASSGTLKMYTFSSRLTILMQPYGKHKQWQEKKALLFIT